MVSKCVLNCIRNVLEHARVEVRMVQRKAKAQRRKLAESMTHLSIGDIKADSSPPTADAMDSPSDANRPPIASKAAEECAVCFDRLLRGPWTSANAVCELRARSPLRKLLARGRALPALHGSCGRSLREDLGVRAWSVANPRERAPLALSEKAGALRIAPNAQGTRRG